MKPQAPCKDCEVRYLGCHSNCTSYLAFKQTMADYHNQTKKPEIDAYQKIAIQTSKSQSSWRK